MKINKYLMNNLKIYKKKEDGHKTILYFEVLNKTTTYPLMRR